MVNGGSLAAVAWKRRSGVGACSRRKRLGRHSCGTSGDYAPACATAHMLQRVETQGAALSGANQVVTARAARRRAQPAG